MKELPIFIFNGFLDGGKTSLLKEIIESDEMYQKGKTLVILTEEGLTELDETWQKQYGVHVEVCLEQEDFTEKYLNALVKKYKPKQVFMEINAFFDFDAIDFPEYFQIYQQVTLLDATKFEMYYNNMKQMINEMVKYSSIIVFNRCQGVNNLASFRRMIRAFNQQGQVAFESENGKMTTMLDEDLPYDINDEYISLNEEDYPVWYLDVFDGAQKYAGKTIKFTAYVRDVTPHSLVVGRQIMTCCEDDIQFYGYEVLSEQFVNNNSLIELECEVIKNYSYIANEEVVMLYAKSIKILPYVEEKYLNFV